MTAYNPQAHFEIKTGPVEFRRTAQRTCMAHAMAKDFTARQLQALRKAA